MRFNKHLGVEGLHAELGASKYHWVNYDDEKMAHVFRNRYASMLCTRKHIWAAEAIRLKQRQQRNNKTLNAYINDAIGFRMAVEVVLYFSADFFGTADAISYDRKTQILRIHDLKTGHHPGSPIQLFIYCALFCLEYNINPYDIQMKLRIYQADQILEFDGDPKEIRAIMDKAKRFANMFEEMREVMFDE
jgi:hypothetical protein